MRRFAAVLLLVHWCATALYPQTPRKPPHVLHAYRATQKVTIDGILNDPIWQKAPLESDFIQRDPIEGVEPSEKTVIQIAYDDGSLYVGVKLYDKEPDKIVRQLSRRDDNPDADYFILELSPAHDGLTGAIFQVSAAGAQRDAIISNDNFQDQSWDGFWESAVHVDDEGWSLEMRIPLSQLRFPKSSHQVWGINAARYIHRKNETVWLQMVAHNDTGNASRMDELEGIDNLESTGRLDLLPYAVSHADFIKPSAPNDPFNSGHRLFGAAGTDLKYALKPNLILDGTVNPDFGNVEVDPAVVNLTAFETFFPEKRQFFLEGASIFNNFGQGGSNNFWGFNRNEPTLFYSRRIGRAPQGTSNLTADFIDAPSLTRILGATKLTGKNRTGWTVGLVEAITNPEYADVQTAGVRSTAEVEPLTNYMAGRLMKEWNRGGIGFLNTSVTRNLQDPTLRDLLSKRANVVGTDGYWFIDSKKDWVLTGRMTGSAATGSAAAISQLQQSPQHYFQRPDAPWVHLNPNATSVKGWQGDINLNRQTGNVTVNAALWGVSPGFESNDLGFQTGGDAAGAHGVLLFRKLTPDKYTRQRNFWIAQAWRWDYGRHVTGNSINGSGFVQFLNWWTVGMGFGIGRTVRDDQLTRGGPAALALSGQSINLNFGTDTRSKISYNLNSSASRNNPHAWGLSNGVNINYKPNPSITISTGPGFDRSRSNAQYVTSVTDPTATRTYGGRYVFADIDQFDVNMTTRVNWVLNPYMSLALFTQPLISIGRYWQFKEFAQPSTYSFLRYGTDIGQISYDASASAYTVTPDNTVEAAPFTFSDPNFNFKSLKVNAIFRWDWHLGSTLYLVWTENRQDLSNPGHFSAAHDVSHLFAHPDDVFLVRVAYWLRK